MGYDQIITHLGDFGRYQKRIYLLLCLPAISCAFHKLAGVFLLARLSFRCILPFENATSASYADFPQEKWHLAYNQASDDKWLTCEYFNVNYTNSYLTANQSIPHNSSLKCEHFVYDHSSRLSSAVSDWHMVCERSILTSTSDSLFMVGTLLGSIIFGQLSDKYGRKPTFFAALVIQVIFGVAAGLAPEYITYTLSRIIIGASTSGVFLVAYVIAMELVGVSYRLLAGVAMQMFFSVGFMLTAAFAYFILDWRALQIALSLPGLIFMVYYWIIPESVRWLLMHNRPQAARERLEHAAKINGVNIPTHLLDNLTKEETVNQPKAPQGSVFDLLKYPNLRRKTLLIFFDWFVNSGVYYSLSWNTNNLGGNELLNFVISGAVEIPAYLFLLFTLNRFGRRTILCGCMLVAGLALLATIWVPKTLVWLTICCAMLGKMAITASYGTVYIFSAEQFPTVVRNAGLGAASMMARVGSILAPYSNELAKVWQPLPFIFCGALAFVGGLLSLLLPETLNKPMPETIADGENFGKKNLPHVEGAEEELSNMLHKTNGQAN